MCARLSGTRGRWSYAVGSERSTFRFVAANTARSMRRFVATRGLSRGEVVGLAWRDVDFDVGTIRIHQTLQVDDGKMYVKGRSRSLPADAALGPPFSPSAHTRAPLALDPMT